MNQAERGGGPSRGGRRAAAGALVLLAAGLAGAGVFLLARHPASPPLAHAPAPLPSPSSAPPAASPSPAAETAAPGFDVIRIGPDRMAVIAGRAPPGAEVRIRDNGRLLATVKADAGGTFVALPATPLSPGAHDFALEALPPGASTPLRAERDALLVVGGEEKGANSPVALAPNGTSPDALPGLIGTEAAKPEGAVAVDVIDYDAAGHVRLSGSAPPGAVLILSADGEKLAETESDAGGHWAAALAKPLAPGAHRLEVFASGRDGTALAHLELPFQRESGTGALTPGAVVVKRGDNLWRIARTVYGQGTRYTLIYAHNRDRIRDPNVIYPGETLLLPSAGQGGDSPQLSKSSR